MDAYFFDSSALAKLYHSEAGTARADQIFRNSASRIRISRLTVVEMSSVCAIKFRTGVISREDAVLFLRDFDQDVISPKFEVVGMQETEFALAERLMQSYAFDMRLRTLDALQLAVAIKLKRNGLVDYFVASDKVVCEVAEREGFAVINPEEV